MKISKLKYYTAIVATLAAVGSFVGEAKAHIVALGWESQPNSDVTFYASHWHGALGAPAGFLSIDGIQYNFTSSENDVTSRTGLDGALFNTGYYTFGSGTLTSLGTAGLSGPVDDWLLVTVSGLRPGTHTFNTDTQALTSWNIPGASGDVSFVVAPVPEPSTYLAGALLLLPFAASTVRRLGKNRTA